MTRTFLVTVQIRRVCGPPRIRSFVVRTPRTAGLNLQALAALVLTLVRTQRRRRRRTTHCGRSGHDDGQRRGSQAAAAPRRGPQLRGSRHSHPTGARRGPGGLPGDAGGAAPRRGATGRARCLGSPARGPG
uniref:Cyclin dependent kinase inhibitor 2A n=1 Tax=Molossus molossus TaxID=27622 RepID=A0A7J8EC60_MOLMO|nr:cyclin dependent kinase inhibitor 2A [Molossus molossus]